MRLSGVVVAVAVVCQLLVSAPIFSQITGGGSGSGGGATPGGDPGTIQFNNAGAFGGFGSWDGSLLTVPGLISKTLQWIGPFTVQFNTANLNTGATISTYTPAAGDFLWDILLVVGSWDNPGGGYFDGTTPFADVGYTASGGLFQVGSGPVDLATGNATAQILDGELITASGSGSGSNYRLSTSVLASAGGLPNPNPLPWRFAVTTPLKVWVSQDGLSGGDAVGGSQGTLQVYLLVSRP